MTSKRIRFGIPLLAVCGLVWTSAGEAQAYRPDPSFGTGGLVIDTAATMRVPRAVALQPDGKILIGGYSGGANAIGVTRYLANGDPDATFVPAAFALEFVYGIALQSDGRILLAGQDDFNIFTVVRLLEGGALDSSFGGDGIVTATLASPAAAWAVAVQPDGKIVASGDADSTAVVARYLTDGTPDPAFGTAGTALVPGVGGVFSMILDSQGRIVTNTSRYLVRLLSGGTPDPGFGIMGVRELGPDFFSNSIGLAPDDEIIVVGGYVSQTAVIEKYTAAGALDPAFGDAGQVRFDGPASVIDLFGTAVLPDGRFYVTGGTGGDFLLGRFLEDGDPDEIFGPEGLFLSNLGAGAFGLSLDLALQADGAIVQIGHASGQVFAHAPALFRYVPCGPPSAPPPSIVSIQPGVVSAGGGDIVGITGSDLDVGAQVRIGNELATVLGSPAPGTINVQMPPAPMGYADVLVINPDCQWTVLAGTLFLHPADVPPGDDYYPFVRRLIVNGVTAGCTDTNYCPGNPVLRGEMAVFLLRSKEGPTYQPPPATGTVFTDVSIFDIYAAWIEELSHRGITAGCDVNRYCPYEPNTRAQMAVFLLVTLEGTSYQPPDPTGVFADVPVSSPYARWVEEIHERGITAGCDATLFCPDDPVLREQMAVFLSVTFSLPG